MQQTQVKAGLVDDALIDGDELPGHLAHLRRAGSEVWLRSRLPADVDPRNFSVSLHMTLLGHVCVHGLMDAIDDQFKQTFEEMLAAMLGVLTHELSDAVEG